MISRFVRGIAGAALAVAFLCPPASAQLRANLGTLNGDNAKGYLGPLTAGLSGTLSTAIFSGASIPIAGLTFDVGVRLMGISFDGGDRAYSPIDPPGFTGIAPVQAPTVIGDSKAVSQSGQDGTTRFHPGGFDLQDFAVVVPQATLGSVLGTRAVVRFATRDLGDLELGDFTLWGLGAQHSVSRYLPTLPVDLAADVFFQKFELNDKLVEAGALHVGLTASKRFGLFEPYTAVGYDRLAMRSKYESSSTSETMEVDFDTESSGHFTLGSTGGFSIIRLYGEITFAAKTGVAAGLSLGR